MILGLTRWAVWGRIRVRSCNRQQLVSRKQWSLPEDWRCSALGSLTVGPPHSGGYFYFVWEVRIVRGWSTSGGRREFFWRKCVLSDILLDYVRKWVRIKVQTATLVGGEL